MAFQTGSQLRPELSAVDYTPFLQAAGQSAQMQAQGYGAAAAGALKGFESFVQQQKENRQLEADVKSAERLGNSLAPFLKDINPEAQAQFGSLISGVNDPSLSLRERASNAKGIGTALSNIIQLAQLGEKTKNEKASAEYEQLLRAGGGAVPAPYAMSATDKFTAEQKMLGEERYLRSAETKARIGEIQAKTKALGVAKAENLTFQEQALASERASFVEKYGRPPTKTEDAEIFSRVAKMSKAETNVTVGEGPIMVVYKDLDSRKNAIDALRNVSASYDSAINEITKSGAFSGPTGALKYAGARALQFFGSNTFKNEADAYQSAASSIASAVLSYARQLPGSASDKDVAFLERVASGGEKVASVDALRKLKARVDSTAQRYQSQLNSRIIAFGESAKGNKDMEFLHSMLTAKPTEPTAEQGTIFDQADAIISR